MKKILSVFLVAGILVACDDSKKKLLTTTTGTTTTESKTDTASVTTPAADSKTTTTTTTTTAAPAGLEVPKFTDAEVQKFAEDYAAYAAMAIKWKDDMSKLEEINTTRGALTARQVDLATKKKLPKTPEEQDKLNDYISKADDVISAADSE
ncbi:MAG: hypothetical protein IPJ81_10950 [Chitinophagaceae bacterium]|nr:hypothetical protein [Chitinophagaceae bacterium]